jgi:acyl-CoA synthetase (AMP-forming)/AMP-acid ligase II
MFIVPSLIHMLNRSRATPPERPLDLLCATGAAPISSEAMASFQAQFGVRLLNLYGLAESSFAVFFGDRDEAGWGTSSIGKPLVAEARLVSEAGVVQDGPAEGHLQLRGPQMSLGYFRNPEATAALFQDGWLDTGDIATRDERGRYVIHGRAKEVVMRGGYSVYLADVDEALLDHPLVQEASSVGVPDPLYGEAIIGVVRLSPEAGEIGPGALRSFCAERLGPDRAPSAIRIVDEPLPRNALGKIMRRELLKWVP